MPRHIKHLWIGLVVLALLSPLGLFLPERFKAVEGAWGEWNAEELGKRLESVVSRPSSVVRDESVADDERRNTDDHSRFVPAGFQKLADIWIAPLADYTRAAEAAPFATHALWYILSAFMGIVFTVVVIYGLTRVLMRSF